MNVDKVEVVDATAFKVVDVELVEPMDVDNVEVVHIGIVEVVDVGRSKVVHSSSAEVVDADHIEVIVKNIDVDSVEVAADAAEVVDPATVEVLDVGSVEMDGVVEAVKLDLSKLWMPAPSRVEGIDAEHVVAMHAGFVNVVDAGHVDETIDSGIVDNLGAATVEDLNVDSVEVMNVGSVEIMDTGRAEVVVVDTSTLVEAVNADLFKGAVDVGLVEGVEAAEVKVVDAGAVEHDLVDATAVEALDAAASEDCGLRCRRSRECRICRGRYTEKVEAVKAADISIVDDITVEVVCRKSRTPILSRVRTPITSRSWAWLESRAWTMRRERRRACGKSTPVEAMPADFIDGLGADCVEVVNGYLSLMAMVIEPVNIGRRPRCRTWTPQRQGRSRRIVEAMDIVARCRGRDSTSVEVVDVVRALWTLALSTLAEIVELDSVEMVDVSRVEVVDVDPDMVVFDAVEGMDTVAVQVEDAEDLLGRWPAKIMDAGTVEAVDATDVEVVEDGYVEVLDIGLLEVLTLAPSRVRTLPPSTLWMSPVSKACRRRCCQRLCTLAPLDVDFVELMDAGFVKDVDAVEVADAGSVEVVDPRQRHYAATVEVVDVGFVEAVDVDFVEGTVDVGFVKVVDSKTWMATAARLWRSQLSKTVDVN
ncbi:hypothetical protein BD626DRAFT_541743 [Schizophyllum amplum]|uniref:Uncharacterized protein n=1 Tax=Schizophyllum amplum TaxID=97359 RepID=A0A550BTL8_9AGAR|nr:hypothetical protein BD626DRAFT_541743 [Auriculariopsis ampla]